MSEQIKTGKLSKGAMAAVYLSHMLITLAVAAGMAYFVNEIILEKVWDEKYIICVGSLLGIIALYSLLARKRIYQSVSSEITLILCFVSSALLLLLSDYYVNFPIWLIGGIVAAALINRNIGILYIYFFIFQAIYLQGNTENGLAFHLLVSTAVCLFIPKMKKWISMLYMLVFSGSLIIGLTIFMNHFMIDQPIVLDCFTIMCGYFAAIFLSMVLVSLLRERKKDEITETDAVNSAEMMNGIENGIQLVETIEASLPNEEFQISDAIAAKMAEQPLTDEAAVTEEVPQQPEATTELSSYCNEKSELLLQLKEKKKAAYAHALLMGKTAQLAAKEIHADAILSKAAGLYAKIGKIYGEEPEETFKVLEWYEFPEEITSVIRQVVAKQPECREAAIVWMADEIVSNYSVIRHGKKLSLAADIIIDKTMSKKMFQGAFDQSGLTVSEYTGIRNAFLNFLEEQDKKSKAK